MSFVDTLRITIGVSLIAAIACAAAHDAVACHPKNAPAKQTGAQPPCLNELYPNLTNLLQVSYRIYSGAQPKTEKAFRDLVQLGVRTVVSVDGSRPDVSTANKYGLRYVHIPIGYDGLSDVACKSLTRVVREADGPYYIHCHHGRHRGPAAAAVASIADGSTDGPNAIAILERAGTSRQYAKLYRDVRSFQPPNLNDQLPELVAVAEVGSLAHRMAHIDRSLEHLELCAKTRWQSPAQHPDVVPSQEALLLRESFRELVRSVSDSKDYGHEFSGRVAAAEQSATVLQQALVRNDLSTATSAYQMVKQQCVACHRAHRD